MTEKPRGIAADFDVCFCKSIYFSLRCDRRRNTTMFNRLHFLVLFFLLIAELVDKILFEVFLNIFLLNEVTGYL